MRYGMCACEKYVYYWDYSKTLRRSIRISDGNGAITSCPLCGFKLQEESIAFVFNKEFLWDTCHWQLFYEPEKRFIRSHVKFREDLLARMSLDPGSLRQENYEFLYRLDKNLGDSIYPKIEEKSSNSYWSEQSSVYSGDDLPF